MEAGPVDFPASDKAANFTGQQISVDGGGLTLGTTR